MQCPSASPPLVGVRVVEVSGDPAGELTGLHLAELGADVVKVEPPTGAESRHIGPFAGGEPDPEGSLNYWYYNAAKRSVTLDLGDREDRARFERLLDEVDVLIISLHPVELRRFDLDLHALVGAKRHLVVVSITPFGLTGPWADYKSCDLVGLATSGLLWTSGYDDHSIPPIRPGGNQAYHTAASFAQIGALLALIQRRSTGEGDLIDVSMHDACAVTGELANPYYFYSRAVVQRQTCRHAQPSPTQPAHFACADGYVYFALVLADSRAWRSLVEWLDSKGLAADLVEPEYDDLAYRQAQFPHIQEVLEAFFLLQPAAVAYHEGQARGLPIGVVNAPEDVFEDEHLAQRGFFESVEHPGWGEVRRPGMPFRFSGYARRPLTRSPRLGEHTEEVLAGLGTGRKGAGSDGEPAGHR